MNLTRFLKIIFISIYVRSILVFISTTILHRNFQEKGIEKRTKSGDLVNISTAFILQFYEGRTESHEQLFFACELGKADEGECGARWNQLLCYP